MSEFLFDPPWYLPLGLAVLALVLLFQGNARRSRPVLMGGLVVLLLAAGVYLVGRFVESDRERVVSATNQLVESVNDNNWPKFKSLLHPNVRFAIYSGAAELAAGAERTVKQVDVKNVAASGIETKPVPGGFEVVFIATGDIGAIGQRAPTNWKLTWAKDSAGKNFLLYRVEALPNEQFGSDPVIARLARP